MNFADWTFIFKTDYPKNNFIIIIDILFITFVPNLNKMACCIKISDIPLIGLQQIHSLLSLKPEIPYHKHNKYGYHKEPEPISFYNEENDIIHLPYLFAG
jgi:hypothetical protein